MLPVVQPFSAGYDMIQLRVVPNDEPQPRIQSTLHSALRERGETRSPVVFRDFGSETHFTAVPDDSVPTDAIELPSDIYEQVDPFPEGSPEVLHIAKPEYAVQLIHLAEEGEHDVILAPELNGE